jgi:membrane protease YdiL (CAAX protease family)
LVIPLSSAFEEAGWQGLALPKLTSRFHPLFANLVHGILWATWHIPAYFTLIWEGTDQPLPLLLAYAIPLSMIMFWLTRKSSGSAIPAIFLHQATNTYSSLFTSAAVFAGTLAAHFTILKTIVYWTIAVVLLIATKGQLGSRTAAAHRSKDELAA